MFSSNCAFSASLYPLFMCFVPDICFHLSSLKQWQTGCTALCWQIAAVSATRDAQHSATSGKQHIPPPVGRLPGRCRVLQTAVWNSVSRVVLCTDFLRIKMWLTVFYIEKQVSYLISHTRVKNTWVQNLLQLTVHFKTFYFFQVMASQMGR